MSWSGLPNEQLKNIRFRLGITTRDVAEFSQKIADTEANPEFHISNAWLTQVENSDSVPSIFKLYSLSAIYRIKFTDLLLLYGVDLQRLAQHQLASPLPETHLTNLEVYDEERAPARVAPGYVDDSCQTGSYGPPVRVEPGDVIEDGEVVGRDPDPNIRTQLEREHSPGGFNEC